MKHCTGISEPNHGSVVQKHTLSKQDDVMEKGRSEAPRGMLFESIFEPLGRQIGKMEVTKTHSFVFVGPRSRAS